MGSLLISTFLQILAFSLIPFIAFLFVRKKEKNFFNYIGLKKTTKKAVYLAVLTSLVIVFGGVSLALISPEIKEIVINPPSVTGSLRSIGFGFTGVFILLINALIRTSFTEEILFRGFLAKRLISKFGLLSGNIVQSLIFALIHVVLFWATTDAKATFLIFIFILSGTAGYLIAFINETHGNGSIIPGWIAHGLGNTISYFVLAFVI